MMIMSTTPPTRKERNISKRKSTADEKGAFSDIDLSKESDFFVQSASSGIELETALLVSRR